MTTTRRIIIINHAKQEEESLNASSLSARVAELERELGSFRRAARQSETDKKVTHHNETILRSTVVVEPPALALPEFVFPIMKASKVAVEMGSEDPSSIKPDFWPALC